MSDEEKAILEEVIQALYRSGSIGRDEGQDWIDRLFKVVSPSSNIPK